MPTRVKLNAEEQALEDKMEVPPRSSARKARIEQFVKDARTQVEREKKSERINIRISASDLNALKQQADDLGIPYQTFIAMKLHGIATGRAQGEPSDSTMKQLRDEIVKMSRKLEQMEKSQTRKRA